MSGQVFDRWFTDYPSTHHLAGQSVEVTPVRADAVEDRPSPLYHVESEGDVEPLRSSSEPSREDEAWSRMQAWHNAAIASKNRAAVAEARCEALTEALREAYSQLTDGEGLGPDVSEEAVEAARETIAGVLVGVVSPPEGRSCDSCGRAVHPTYSPSHEAHFCPECFVRETGQVSPPEERRQCDSHDWCVRPRGHVGVCRDAEQDQP